MTMSAVYYIVSYQPKFSPYKIQMIKASIEVENLPDTDGAPYSTQPTM